MVYLIEGCAIEQEQVFVVAAAMYIQARHELDAWSHARREL